MDSRVTFFENQDKIFLCFLGGILDQAPGGVIEIDYQFPASVNTESVIRQNCVLSVIQVSKDLCCQPLVIAWPELPVKAEKILKHNNQVEI